MYKLVHEKVNALNEIALITERMVTYLAETSVSEDGLEAVFTLLAARQDKMNEVDQLDQRLAFLSESGYETPLSEAERITLEQGSMRALLFKIKELDERMTALVGAARAGLMEALKDVKDGQKSIMAYAGPPEEEEGRAVDTRR